MAGLVSTYQNLNIPGYLSSSLGFSLTVTRWLQQHQGSQQEKKKGQEQKSVSSGRAVPEQTYSDQPDLYHILTPGPIVAGGEWSHCAQISALIIHSLKVN